MTGLFIRIVQEDVVDQKTGMFKYSISCDNVTNETASNDEIILANEIEKHVAEILQTKIADVVLQFEMKQKSPNARKEQNK